MKNLNRNCRIILSVSAAALVGLTACQQQPEGIQSEEPESANIQDAAPTDPTSTPAPKASFAGMDGNSDGSITAAEHADATAAMFAAMDSDKDGSVTAAEMDASIGAMGGSTTMLSADKIKTIDQNKDGKLSAAEHRDGSKSMFDKMDTEKSGALNETEYNAGHKALE